MNLKPLLFLSMLVTLQLSAQDAYQITVNLKPLQAGRLYLAHHYGSKQYLVDSADIRPDGAAVFSGKEKLFGGVYMIVFPKKNNWIECIIDKEQQFSVYADTADLFGSIRFTGSPDNALFATYQQKSYALGTELSALQKRVPSASPAVADSLKAAIAAKGRALQDYREAFLNQYPDHLLSAIFRTLREPSVPPASAHPGGRYDSAYAYQFYKQHYWDGVSFTDERLVRTPVFQPKLDRYFSQVLTPHTDTLIQAADQMLLASKPSPEMFKFILSTLTDKYVNPAYMGQDAVFVHLFQKYYLTGQADSWMSEKYKKFIYDRGYSLITNLIGAPGADFPFVDTAGRKGSLYAVKGQYTVLCFWDPTCGHCQEEVPKLDSLYRASWKSKGVTIVGLKTEGPHSSWLKFIQEHNLKDWLHVYQTQEMKDADQQAGRAGLRQLYDVYQTPMLYLLDKDKRIIAKKLNYQQLNDLLQVKWQGAAAH